MLLGVFIIIVFLFIALYFTINLNNQLGISNNQTEDKIVKTVEDSKNVVDKGYYLKKINRIYNATQSYIDVNNVVVSRTPFNINISELIDKDYLDVINDSKTGNRCDGYSKVYLDNSDIVNIKAYLKCDSYVSEGFGE